MRLRAPVFASIFLAFSIVGCAAGSSDAIDEGGAAATALDPTTSIRPSTDPRHRRVASIDGLRGVENDQGLQIAIYESLGDAATNGNQLILSASDESGAGGVFDLGLDINTLHHAEMAGPGVVRLIGTFDRPAEGGIESALPFDATVALTVTADGVGSRAVVTFNGERHEVTAATDEGSRFLPQLFDRHPAESIAELAADLYEADLGAAQNGTGLLLVVKNENEEETYDLGVFVSRVTKFEFIRDFAVRIEAVESSGGADPVSTRVVYEAELSLNGNKPDLVTLKKL
jgi:hypothetical protein